MSTTLSVVLLGLVLGGAVVLAIRQRGRSRPANRGRAGRRARGWLVVALAAGLAAAVALSAPGWVLSIVLFLALIALFNRVGPSRR